jgi:cytochrome c peroxidase
MRLRDPVGFKENRMVKCLNRGFGLMGAAAAAIVFAQSSGGIPPGTTPYNLIVPPGFPKPTIPIDNQLTNEGVALGKRLFSEKKLSGNGTQACSSCHHPTESFSDEGDALSTGSTGVKGTRNAPALINLVYQRCYFWDGRSPSLRAQALVPIQNPLEMNQTIDGAVANLKADPTYVSQFATAFGSKGITGNRIALAIEQYEISTLYGNSKYDRVQQGLASLTPQEQRGLTLFLTPYKPKQGQFGADCARCHSGALFSDFCFRNNGLDANPADPGREDVTGEASDYGKFKTPSLRNLTVTGPYMHDGRFSTLEEVVQHYSSGIVPSATLDPMLAKEPGGVQLSTSDQAALVAFLKTLVEPQFQGNGNP